MNAARLAVKVDAHHPFRVEMIGGNPLLDCALVRSFDLQQHSAAVLTGYGAAHIHFARGEGLRHQFTQSLFRETGGDVGGEVKRHRLWDRRLPDSMAHAAARLDALAGTVPFGPG
jgi:hypothetical protein